MLFDFHFPEISLIPIYVLISPPRSKIFLSFSLPTFFSISLYLLFNFFLSTYIFPSSFLSFSSSSLYVLYHVYLLSTFVSFLHKFQIIYSDHSKTPFLLSNYFSQPPSTNIFLSLNLLSSLSIYFFLSFTSPNFPSLSSLCLCIHFTFFLPTFPFLPLYITFFFLSTDIFLSFPLPTFPFLYLHLLFSLSLCILFPFFQFTFLFLSF